MFWVLKITVSLIRLFYVSTTYVMAETFDYALLSWGLFNGYYNINNFLCIKLLVIVVMIHILVFNFH